MKFSRMTVMYLVFFFSSFWLSCYNNNTISFFNNNIYFKNICTNDSTTFNKSGVVNLVFYIENGNCSGCLLNLKDWEEAMLRYNSQKTYNIKYIFKPCDTIYLKHNLELIDLKFKTYWDNNSIVENEIYSTDAYEIIMFSSIGKVLGAFDIYAEKKESIVKKWIN